MIYGTRARTGVMEIPKMEVLQILFHLTNPYFRMVVFGSTLVFLYLEIRSRKAPTNAAGVDDSDLIN